MKVLIVGGTGLIGRRLARTLAQAGDEVVAVSRAIDARVDGATYRRWDPIEGPLVPEALDGVDAVVNLAGAPLQSGRWSQSRKRELWDSRVGTTQRIVESLEGSGVQTFISGSAVGYYGPGDDEELTEDSPAGDDFLADLASAWEAVALEASARAGVRVVLLRTGVVLAREGGALPVVARPVKLGAGGPIGGGRQWVPWIHIDDVVGIVRLALTDHAISGPINAVSREPVRQKDFVKTMGSVLGRPAAVPTPAFVLRAAMGEMATLALDGQRVVPAKAEAAGYEFAYPSLEGALQAELG